MGIDLKRKRRGFGFRGKLRENLKVNHFVYGKINSFRMPMQNLGNVNRQFAGAIINYTLQCPVSFCTQVVHFTGMVLAD